jgi:hypothetical protein
LRLRRLTAGRLERDALQDATLALLKRGPSHMTILT